MTDRELNDILRSAKLPEPSPEHWQNFPRQIAREIGRPRRTARAELPARWQLPAWSVGFAAACLAIGLGLGWWRDQHPRGDGVSVATGTQLIRELTAMFPNRLRAVVADKRGIQLLLSDHADVPTSTPLYLRLCDGRRCQTVITFSGQQVRALDENLEILSSARGQIMVIREGSVWSSAEPHRAANGFNIEARELESAL